MKGIQMSLYKAAHAWGYWPPDTCIRQTEYFLKALIQPLQCTYAFDAAVCVFKHRHTNGKLGSM